MSIQPNCFKIVCNRNGELGSIWSKSSLGEFFRTYEIGKRTYPKEGILLFCYLLNNETLTNDMFYCPSTTTYLAYAEDLKSFEFNENFSAVPVESVIRSFWDKSLEIKCDTNQLRANWALASSITLLKRLQ